MSDTHLVIEHGSPWATRVVTVCLGGLVALLLYRVLATGYYSLDGDRNTPRQTDYADIFPPSQHKTLSEVQPGRPRSQSRVKFITQSSLLPMTADYRSADENLLIFSGFKVGEVKSLGSFPDYATLSGVPLPSPITDFDIGTALPRPYRPFRWNYHQTMGYFKMDADYWIELENTYRDRIHERQRLWAQNGEKVLQALPGSELACKELLEMVIQFLCARYPKAFSLKGNALHNHILNTTADLDTEEPLHVLMNHVPEDFALILRDESTGRYIFRAGIICSALGWTLGTKIGQDMSAIHSPVPHFKDKLEFSLDRFFTKMKAPNPIQRGSWGLEAGQPLYLPADDPAFSHREVQDPTLKVRDIHLRVDWQTLRRLPLSGAIIFNYKALFTPITEFRDEPYIPSLVLKILDRGDEEIMKYKGTWHVEHVAKEALEEYERWQIDQGLIERDWEHRTLDEAPFFPGWEEKWKAQTSHR
jgi:hypothetical protein